MSSTDTKEIKRYDAKTGQFIDNFIGPDALGREPNGLTFGPDGNLYVATRANDIKRFNGTTGKFIDVFITGNGVDNPLCIYFKRVSGNR